MIIRFINLGIIEKAEIDISAPLIIFTGQNGTGKTYLSYALYDIRNSMGGQLVSLITSSRKQGKQIKTATFDPEDLRYSPSIITTLDPKVLYSVYKRAVKDISQSVLASIYFNIANPEGFKIELVTTEEDFEKELYELELDCGFGLRFQKKTGSYDVIITNREKSYEIIDKVSAFHIALLLNSIFFYGDATANMFCAERLGISMFSKEISIGRLKYNQIDTFKYPSPISHSLAYAENRKRSSAIRSSFASFADEIENSILKGSIVDGDNGELIYKTGEKVFDINECSSTVKALSEFVFYLRHSAFKMSLLIVDEPEIHLHPDNQVILARIFAKMVNKGIRLLISTHSDYILRELNNLIMLDSINVKKLEDEYHLGYVKDESLSAEKLRVYLLSLNDKGKTVVENIPVSKEGFFIRTIDDAINKQNNASDLIYEALMEKKGL